jgi:signal transduction histidine kinase
VPAPRRPPLASLPRAALAERLASTGVTANGLPEAVVARLVLGPATARPEGTRSVGERLLEGELPVRPEDLPFLAGRLGLASDPRVETLARRLRSVPAVGAPLSPEFRRTAAGAVLEGVSRTADGFLTRYELPLARLVEAASAPGGPLVSLAHADGGRALAEGGRRVEVSGVEGLALHVRPRPVDSHRLIVMRAVVWLSVLVGAGGLVVLRRSLRREAKAIDRERAFLASVTHELRSPLTAIRVLGETLAAGRGAADEYGALIAQESERLEALVERVLTLTRFQEALRLSPVDPGELVRTTVSLVRLRAGRRGTRLASRVAEGLPECRWDADAVRRALLNLLDNAIQHGRANGVVEVSARSEDGAVAVAVADDGPGIGRGDRRRIFGRFERGLTDVPGTGLGLFLVEAVARAHGGRVDLATAEGRGSTFTLVLPVQPPDLAEGAAR